MPNPYLSDLHDRLWSYVNSASGRPGLLDPAHTHVPVFRKDAAHLNIIQKPGATDAQASRVIAFLPAGKRHKWFRSMRSSQALTQSLFGNLTVHNKLHLLAGLQADCGSLAFYLTPPPPHSITLDYPINYLGEPRPTSVDVRIDASYCAGVEVKLAEAEIGKCSRTTLSPLRHDYCDGTYTFQRGRLHRCSLTAVRNVQYWHYIPHLFTWDPGCDHLPCPLHSTYQLVRNVLASCVRPDGSVSPHFGHALLLYDDRNPAFQQGGPGLIAFQRVHAALKHPDPPALRKCSWQVVAERLRTDPELAWLTQALHAKYGL